MSCRRIADWKRRRKTILMGAEWYPMVPIKKTYCPQSFSRGGLYSKGSGLLLCSVVGDCDYGGCEKVTLFGSNCDDGLIAVIGVQYNTDRSGYKLVTLFGSDCDVIVA